MSLRSMKLSENSLLKLLKALEAKDVEKRRKAVPEVLKTQLQGRKMSDLLALHATLRFLTFGVIS